MLLILSEHEDVSTDHVTEWLQYYNIPFLRINDDSNVNAVATIELGNGKTTIELNIDGARISLDDISSVWFRRGYFRFFSRFNQLSEKHPDLKRQVDQYLKSEHNTLNEFVVEQLLTKRSLNNPLHYNANKLSTLNNALRAGLKIPHTLITRKLSDVANLLDIDSTKVITKPIQDIHILKINGLSQSQYTETLASLPEVNESFHYSLFQQKIEKKYELRIFFVDKDFYACAIFSSATDGRDLYASDKLARIVPYEIPSLLKEKLIFLNQLNNLNSGSIDILVDQNNEYYFLEVNPVGQFDYVSKLGNHYLEQKIAKYFHAT